MEEKATTSEERLLYLKKLLDDYGKEGDAQSQIVQTPRYDTRNKRSYISMMIINQTSLNKKLSDAFFCLILLSLSLRNSDQ